MAQMKVIGMTGAGGPEVLRLELLPIPVAGVGQVLVKVATAGINRPDILQRKGGYAPPPGAPATLGLEIAGEVVGLGEGCTRFKKGEQVCALVPGGGYAEYAVVAEDNTLPVPKGLSLIEASALPENYFTVWTNVFDRGHLQPRETFLVHGGSSGISNTPIQLAKQFGARVIATAGSDEKCGYCEKLGADLAINYKTADFVAELERRNMSPDLVLDMAVSYTHLTLPTI